MEVSIEVWMYLFVFVSVCLALFSFPFFPAARVMCCRATEHSALFAAGQV